MTLDELTNQLGELYRRGRKYDFIERAHGVLSQVSSAPRLAEMTLRALLEMGLGGPARELLQLRADLRWLREQNAELSRQISAAPNGRVPWGECADTFGSNVTSLRKRHREWQELVDKWAKALAEVHLYRTREGHHLLSRRRPGHSREWLCSLTTAKDGEGLKLPPKGQLGPVAVVGVRLGAVLERVYQDTRHVLLWYNHPLYILEPDPLRFTAWLHGADHRGLLEDERVYLFVGENAADRLADLLTADCNLPVPVVYVNQSESVQGAAMTVRVREAAEQATRHHHSERARCLEQLGQRYAERSLAYWAERFQAPGRVLGLTSRFTTVLQYSMRDALHALEEMGFEPHLLIEGDDHHQLSGLEICQKILELDPVMMVSLDHLRYEMPHIPVALPVLTWIQDPLDNLLCSRAGASIGPFDFVCGYFRDICTAEFGYPPEAFLTTPLPVSTRLFHDGETSEADRARYACDVCFVSNASQPLDQFYATALSSYPASYRPLLELLYRRAWEYLDGDDPRDPGPAARDLTRSAAGELGIELEGQQAMHLSAHFVYRLLDWGRRQQTLEWVANWARRTGRSLRIYGRGWETHPTLAEFAGGVLEHGEPLRCAYRAAKLGLQLIPAGFQHQRALEVLASGTLPLARYCPADFAELPIETYVARREQGLQPEGTATLFPRLERIVFRTPEEFETLAERYLTDKPERQQVLHELREVVLRDYTYAAVMGKVMAAFREALTRQGDQ